MPPQIQNRKSKIQIAAAFVSTLFHPLLVIPVTVLLLTRDLRVSAIIAAATVLPLLALTLRNVRRGTWSNFDVSEGSQRTGLYFVAVPLTFLGAGVLAVTGAPPPLIRGTAIAGGLLLAAFLLSPFLKTSLHLLFAAWCGVLIMRATPETAWFHSIGDRHARLVSALLEAAHDGGSRGGAGHRCGGGFTGIGGPWGLAGFDFAPLVLGHS